MNYNKLIDELEVIKAQAAWEYPLNWQITLDNAITCVKKCRRKDNYTTESISEPMTINIPEHPIPDDICIDSPITCCNDPAFRESYINGYVKGMSDCLKNMTDLLEKK